MNSTGRKAAVFLLVTAAVFLGGCGATRPSKYYQLTIPGEASAGQNVDPAPVTLLVGTLLAPDLYREGRIVYSTTGEEMGTYQYQRWAEPPTEMIQEVLLRELRSSGRYHAVFVHRSDAKGDFLLRGRLYDFKEVSENGMMGRFTADFEMRDLKTGGIVWTHYYHYDEPVNGKNVPAVVAALDKNVQRAVKEVLESLDQYFAAHPAK